MFQFEMRIDNFFCWRMCRNLGLIRADVSRLPFASGSVDAVHAGAAMHCWPSPSNAVSDLSFFCFFCGFDGINFQIYQSSLVCKIQIPLEFGKGTAIFCLSWFVTLMSLSWCWLDLLPHATLLGPSLMHWPLTCKTPCYYMLWVKENSNLMMWDWREDE